MRSCLAYLLTPVLKLTGFRFSKAYRHGESRFYRAVYACVNTVEANLRANGYWKK
jgi:hypothetical protein